MEEKTTMKGHLPLYTIDASVVLKWYYQKEEKSVKKAFQLRDDYKLRRIDLIAPSLLVYELTNVLRYKKDLEREYIEEAVESIYEMRILREISKESMKEAVNLALESDITIYDASYLSFAEIQHHTPLITADLEFYEKVKGRGSTLFIADYR
jgi:predicted nucleic acid-binding protein